MKCLKPYDVFISHVAEDKTDIANPLYSTLRSLGLRVWYSGAQLQVGDSISKSIAKGLRQSRYGIVILSASSFSSGWVDYELQTLFAQQDKRNPLLLPLLHGITREQVRQRYPWLADIVSIHTADGVEAIARKLHGQIMKQNPVCAWLSLLVYLCWTYQKKIYGVLAILSMLAAGLFAYQYYCSLYPCNDLVDAAIRERIARVNRLALQDTQLCTPVSMDELCSRRSRFDQQSSVSLRHVYHYSDQVHELGSRAALEAWGIPIDALGTMAAKERHDDARLCQYVQQPDGGFYLSYVLLPVAAVQYQVRSLSHTGENTCIMRVAYSQQLRAVHVECSYEAKENNRHEKTSVTGLPHEEEWLFEKKGGEWSYTVQ